MHQVIHVHSAQSLIDKDWFAGLSDPYFICRIGSRGSSWDDKGIESDHLEFRSLTIKNKANPEWDAKYSIDLSEDWVKFASLANGDNRGLELTLQIYDEDQATRHDDLGSLTVPVPKEGQQEVERFPIPFGFNSVLSFKLRQGCVLFLPD